MIFWLDKNENYGWELLELFSIGVGNCITPQRNGAEAMPQGRPTRSTMWGLATSLRRPISS